LSDHIGYIPDQVKFFLRNHRSVETQFNNWIHGSRVAWEGHEAFPVSMHLPASSTTWDTAKYWTRSAEEPVVLDNTPKGGYTIIGAEQRGEGGRAWKVLSPEGYLVDLREDVFMPILLTQGLPRSRVIRAKFQWCVNGSQLRLEKVGSDQWKKYLPYAKAQEAKKAAVKARKAKAPSTLNAADLEVGGVYQFKQWGIFYQRAYLGKFWVKLEDGTKKGGARLAWTGHFGWGPDQLSEFTIRYAIDSLRGRHTFGTQELYTQLTTQLKCTALRKVAGPFDLPDNWKTKRPIAWERTDSVRCKFEHGIIWEED
jgi:hypothetical protein